MDRLPDRAPPEPPPCVGRERRHGNRNGRERTSRSWQIEEGTGSRGSSVRGASGSEAHEANGSGTDMTASLRRGRSLQVMDTMPALAAESSESLRSIGSRGQSLPRHSRKQPPRGRQPVRRQRGHQTSVPAQEGQAAAGGTTGVPRASRVHGSQSGGCEPRLALARSPLVRLAHALGTLNQLRG